MSRHQQYAASPEATPADQAVLVESLQDPALYDHPVEQIRVQETHISWVILTGTYAYKIKKPVDFGFLDFSTLERRRPALLGLCLLAAVAGRALAASQPPERGEYVFHPAGCAACHTDVDNDGTPLTGGRALKTPFGTFYSPNITPDPVHGIGGWSDDESAACSVASGASTRAVMSVKVCFIVSVPWLEVFGFIPLTSSEHSPRPAHPPSRSRGAPCA